jgi:iron(III) transport system substrate-binding protein
MRKGKCAWKSEKWEDVMTRWRAKLTAVLAFAVCAPALCAAAEPQALQEVGATHKQALRALISTALKEGSVSYWDTIIQPGTNAKLAAAFRQYYGLPANFAVNYSLSSTTGMVTRVEQEVSAGRVTMDVAAVASLPWVNEKVKAGKIMHYESPQYQFYHEAFDKGLGKDGYYAFNGAYVFIPMWNSEKLDFKGTSWKDVDGAVGNGRMVMGDVGKSETYLATYMGLRLLFGLDYFKRLAAMKPVFLVRSEQIAQQLVTGQDLMSFSGMPTRAFQVNQRGAKLKFLFPKEGVVLLPQAMFILAAAPHPAAAKLWVDFMLSDIGQKIMVDNEAVMSGRKGFVSPIPTYAPPIDSLNVIKIDWDKLTTADMQKARAEWRSIFNP